MDQAAMIRIGDALLLIKDPVIDIELVLMDPSRVVHGCLQFEHLVVEAQRASRHQFQVGQVDDGGVTQHVIAFFHRDLVPNPQILLLVHSSCSMEEHV